MKYSAIDLHSNNSVLAIIDEDDRVVFEKRLPNDLQSIHEALCPYASELKGVVVESTYNWYWLVDGLQELHYPVFLANTAAIAQYSGLKHRDDKSDARHLAHLLRLDLLRTGHVMPKETRVVRDLTRKRSQLVRSRTQHLLAVDNLQSRQNLHKVSSAQIKRLPLEAVLAWGLDKDVVLAIQSNLAVIHVINQQIETLEARILSYLKQDERFRVLKTIPGIGDILAMTIVLETGDIGRFAKVGNYASYCRCVDSTHTSNDKLKGRGNKRNGNQYLAWAFMEAATFAKRWSPEAQKFYERKKAKRNGMIATKALAHKLARASYHLLSTGEEFDVERCFA